MTAKSTTKRPARLQIYISDPALVSALQDQAKKNRLSLSQTAQHILNKGLLNKSHNGEMGNLERRIADQTRLLGRDLVITQELLFITLRTLCSRIPENPLESDLTYQGSVDLQMSHILNEVSERLRQSRLNSRQSPPPLHQDSDHEDGDRASPDPEGH